MSRLPSLTIAIAAVALGTVGCVTKQTHYRWGNYDDVLYANYKNPQDRQVFVASLKAIILDAEKQGVIVPPGIYAEYGYALYEEGNRAEAIAYFTEERNTWPESQVFMEKMIANAQREPARPPPAESKPPTGPAAALEKGTS